MSTDSHSHAGDGRPRDEPSPVVRRLERATAAVLIAVLASLVWMSVAAFWPETGRFVSTTVEVVLIIILLTAALALVSIVALLHTRRSDRD